MDFRTPGATVNPTLHPLWVPKPKPKRRRKPRQAKPRRKRIVIGPAAACHIEGQRVAIAILARTLALIKEALDNDDAETAADIASTALAELRKVVYH